MPTLGETIKALRKEKKLTQSDVAGEQMTKGMLSLIENDKAQPSMDNLKYIATKLQVDVGQLMGDYQDQQALRALIREAEMMLQDWLHVDKRQVLDLLTPHVEKFKPLTTFEEIRLFDLYSQMALSVHHVFDEQTFLQLSERYENLGLYDYMIHCYFSMMGHAFFSKNYPQVFQYITDATKKFEQYYLVISDAVKLDFYYNKMIAATTFESGYSWKNDAEKALSLSKQTRLYYRTNDFYRFLFTHAIEERDDALAKHYLNKLTLYSELAELPLDRAAVHLFTMTYEIFIQRDIDAAIQIPMPVDPIVNDVFDFDISHKALLCYCYLQKEDFETCYETWKEMRVADEMAHPLDRLAIFFGIAAGAMAAYELGHTQEAKKEILFILNEIKDYPRMSYTKFIEDVAKKVL
ncbi:helix-turn-helix domain-containing protein [Kurthia massiliensis]|uniref:helix-turn-helix domain-containing protein n=1 Tax=Kurthia massiliensis TaxID=1033739 RepID=UPI0002894DC7|nr:helix-turn-helix transcriptional regulator [Kurthia massiliensis]